jgi:signal transduction histidine kinase
MAAHIPEVTGSMTRLVDDLLTFTEAELPGGMPITPAPADLAAIGKQLVDQYQSAHPDVPVAFRVSGDLVGQWDAARLQQALSNLLGNAFQHGTHAENGGAATDSVELDLAGDADAVTVAIRNDGPPIPAKLLPVIFDPMVRGENARRRPGSMGLGLSIARAVVLAHGARSTSPPPPSRHYLHRSPPAKSGK